LDNSTIQDETILLFTTRTGTFKHKQPRGVSLLAASPDLNIQKAKGVQSNPTAAINQMPTTTFVSVFARSGHK